MNTLTTFAILALNIALAPAIYVIPKRYWQPIRIWAFRPFQKATGARGTGCL